jgi:hypothetical protein
MHPLSAFEFYEFRQHSLLFHSECCLNEINFFLIAVGKCKAEKANQQAGK